MLFDSHIQLSSLANNFLAMHVQLRTGTLQTHELTSRRENGRRVWRRQPA